MMLDDLVGIFCASKMSSLLTLPHICNNSSLKITLLAKQVILLPSCFENQYWTDVWYCLLKYALAVVFTCACKGAFVTNITVLSLIPQLMTWVAEITDVIFVDCIDTSCKFPSPSQMTKMDTHCILWDTGNLSLKSSDTTDRSWI